MFRLQYEREIEHAVGDIVFFPHDDIEDGFLLLDGESYLIEDFPELFLAIGRTFGGDATHFTLPVVEDFIRCLNTSSSGADSNRAAYSTQADDLEDHAHGSLSTAMGGSHNHSVQPLRLQGPGYSVFDGAKKPGGTMGSVSGALVLQENTTHTHTPTVANSAEAETAPQHIRMVACVYAGGYNTLAYESGG